METPAGVPQHSQDGGSAVTSDAAQSSDLNGTDNSQESNSEQNHDQLEPENDLSGQSKSPTKQANYRRRWPWQRRRSSVDQDVRTVHVNDTNDTTEEWFDSTVDLDSSGISDEEEDTDEDGLHHSKWKHRNRFRLRAEGFQTKCKVSRNDGRLKLAMNETANNGVVAKLVGGALHNHLNSRPTATKGHGADLKDGGPRTENLPIPKLNIVVMVIGSRGDIQPFVKVGQILKQKHGHRVRIATHPTFRKLVEEDCGLELFSVGGDPSELMAFMVKNPGLIPSFDTVKKGEVGRRRQSMFEMFQGFWKACIEPLDDETRAKRGSDAKNAEPFVADAIIANPPSFAHVHCAERLGCPLHIMFTFPYTPTTQFPHPLANIKEGNVEWDYVNFMSFSLVELMTWQGLGDLVNSFRQDTLNLDPVSTIWAPGQLFRLQVPHSYMWSPGLVPKPHDWGPEIDVTGFVFLDLASNFTPPDDLVKFLDAGEPPVYIGFGSIVVDDPEKFTKMIFEAVKQTGVRALVNQGWGGFGGDGKNTPENVFMIENTPHDWLFPKCKAVIHHGGAGTTAIGLKCGKPTMIVPFFGDQPFWGDRVAEAKAGAHQCIPYSQLDVERFAKGIKECLTEESQEKAKEIAEAMNKEGDGAENAVNSFHKQLPLSRMRCSVLPDRVAAWKLRNSHLGLSPLAKEVLMKEGKISKKELKLWRTYAWNDYQGPGTPLTGATETLVRSTVQFGKRLQSGPKAMRKDIQKHAKSEKGKTHGLEEQNPQPADGETNIILPQNTEDEKPTVEHEKNTQPSEEPSDQQTLGRVQTNMSKSSANNPLVKDLLLDATKGVGRPFETLITAPIDLTLSIGTGLHNLPILYHDQTVRKPIRIHNFKSGAEAAQREFKYEFYDSFAGLVKLPYKDMKKAGRDPTTSKYENSELAIAEDDDNAPSLDTDKAEGGAKHPHLGKARGFATGVGKGIAGLAIKQTAALTLPTAFVAKGLQKEINGRLRGGRDALVHAAEARSDQGKNELRMALSIRESSNNVQTTEYQQLEEKVANSWKQLKTARRRSVKEEDAVKSHEEGTKVEA